MKKRESRQEQSRIKQRRWQAHIHAWEKSGLPQNGYCRQHKLSSSQFCYWKRKLKRTKISAVSFVPVPVYTSKQKSDVPVSNSSGLTIVFDSGIKIGLDNNFNVQALTDAVLVLKT